MDPRVKTPAAGLLQQLTLSKQLYDGVLDAQAALEGDSRAASELRAFRAGARRRAR